MTDSANDDPTPAGNPPLEDPDALLLDIGEQQEEVSELVSSVEAELAKQVGRDRSKIAQLVLWLFVASTVATHFDAGDANAATEAYKTATPIIDRMAGKGLIHKNKAARHKSRLNQHVRSMQS